MPEALIWEGIITSERASMASTFSALGLATRARDILEQPGDPSRVQPCDVTVHMALAALHGLSYSIPDLRAGASIDATTHLDWGEFTFHPNDPPGGVALWFIPMWGGIALALRRLVLPLVASGTVKSVGR